MTCTRVLHLLTSSLVLLVGACSAPTPPISVLGRWRYSTPQDVNYPVLEFEESTAVFSSRADTLYRFRYTIDQATRTLQLTDWKGYHWRVLVLRADADSLVVDQLHEKKGIQRYSRLSDFSPTK